MTNKINLTIQVDAPTPEQFERYLAASGWDRKRLSFPSNQRSYYPPIDVLYWESWVRGDDELAMFIRCGSPDYSRHALSFVEALAKRAGKTSIEVYNEIVKVDSAQ